LKQKNNLDQNLKRLDVCDDFESEEREASKEKRIKLINFNRFLYLKKVLIVLCIDQARSYITQ
jgi:hypothetical protein